MLSNYITIAFRNLMRFKWYSLINLFGISLGLTVGILIWMFVSDELAFDLFHSKKDRIYKVVSIAKEGGINETNAWPVGRKLKEEFPEVEDVMYSVKGGSTWEIKHEGKKYAQNIIFASPSFLSIFTFPLIEGDITTALTAPNSLVITQEMAEKYFGSISAVGQNLMMRDSILFQVTGVVENVPKQSHIQFDMIASFATAEKYMGYDIYSEEGWGNFNVRNYILIKEGASAEAMMAKAKGMYMDSKNAGDRFRELGIELELGFVPLSDMYLKSEVYNGMGPKGSLDRLYLVSGIALFVILLACINFVNLSTARAVYRSKEVGIRKMSGSSRGSLILQFLSESFVITFLSFIVVALAIDFVLPFFNSLLNKSFVISDFLRMDIIAGVVVILVTVSLLSGIYPAFYMSSLQPAAILKGRMQGGRSGSILRRGLVIFQFFVSGILMVGTLLVVEQLEFMRSKDLGFDKDQVMVLDLLKAADTKVAKTLMTELSSLPQVQSTTFTNALPSASGWLGQWAYDGEIEGAERVDTEYMAIDENYLNTLGLTLIAGENFDLSKPALLEEGLIINETAVKEFGWGTAEQAIGKSIVSPSQHPQGKVIGVVKDYHGLGLQEVIWSVAMDYKSQEYGRYIAIRFAPGSTQELVGQAEAVWKNLLPDTAFQYFFLDDHFDAQYKAEERLMTVFLLFAGITIFIAIIGLLGLISFVIVTRTREIGIRKVLGAGSIGMATLLSREFVVLILIANALAWPLAWYFGKDWLSGFAFHTEFSPWLLLQSLGLIAVFSLSVVVFQMWRTSRVSPVDILKSE